MISYTYRCTLLKPLVLLARPGTETNATSLDYIPGSVFRGLVASGLYDSKADKKEQTLDVFHNGTVQFGDAHLVINDKRSHHIPAVFFKPKATGASEVFLHHLSNKANHKIKQIKEGYIVQDDKGNIFYSKIAKGMRIKSARDEKTRSSKTGQLFMYQHIEAQQIFEFTIRSKNEEYLKLLDETLSGRQYIGKSRSAEFGSVLIERTCAQSESSTTLFDQQPLIIYADSHLCLSNEFGELTWKPEPRHFGLSEGQINWHKSKIWQDRYSPWNAHRKTWDPERLIIKKGSVIVIEEGSTPLNSAVNDVFGHFRSEGMGRVIFNPSFISRSSPTIQMIDQEPALSSNAESSIGILSKKLIESLKEKQKDQEDQNRIDDEVNKFKEEQKKIAKISPSQWGAIYARTQEVSNDDELERILFAEDRENRSNRGFLRRGKMAQVWENEGHLNTLRTFLDERAPAGKKIDLLVRLTLELAKHHNVKSNQQLQNDSGK